ncbi:LysE family translocator [Altererythrobacter aquiaggeris]|uniref:LysE family translocator n=1 Tax=Aestuarierythrobacter aquiaggeris TaxID=1898396 RepID=UPI0030160095
MDWLGFAIAVLLIELTPGPNMAWLVALTLSAGKRHGLAATAGIALGLAGNAALAAAGLAALFAAEPAVERWIGFGGAAMMVWLAWSAWQNSADTSAAVAKWQTPRRDFAAGFLINLFNPKAAVFYLAVVPQFIDGTQPTLAQAITLGMISVAIATTVHLVLVLGATRARPFVADPARTKFIRRFLAIIMLAVAAWFIRGALS